MKRINVVARTKDSNFGATSQATGLTGRNEIISAEQEERAQVSASTGVAQRAVGVFSLGYGVKKLIDYWWKPKKGGDGDGNAKGSASKTEVTWGRWWHVLIV